jgi:hypothetical protein
MRTRQLFCIAISLLIFSLPVLSQTGSKAQRIELKANRATTMTGEIKDRKEVVYTFSAKAGQKFTGRISRRTGDASFNVTDPDGEALPEEEYEVNTKLQGSLTKSGDYKITVNTFNSANSKYTLSVRVY